MSQAPKPTPRSRIVERIVARPGLSNRLKARRFGLDVLLRRPPVLELYYEAGDPHSHLAAQLLPQLQQRLNIPVHVRLVGEPETAVYPEADKQRAFALTDAARIAPAWGLDFPADPQRPNAEACLNAARILLGTTDLDAFCRAEAALAGTLFNGQTPTPRASALDAGATRTQLAENHKRRAWLGNYLPGVWQLNGNWYWGVDRLDHRAADLRAGGWLQDDGPLLRFDAGRARLPAVALANQHLEFFFSFRSPYSYLAVEALRTRDSDWPVPLRVRPVLPMAMRGMKIPPYKGLYIARDAKREANKRGIAFGRIADPLGVATQRCLTVFNLLKDPVEQMNFLQSHCRAVWSQGIDVATDEGLRYVWERAGQSWPQARDKLAQGMDLELAEQNRQALFAAGGWGVPSFALGDFFTWGNDRIWMLEELFRRQAPQAAREASTS